MRDIAAVHAQLLPGDRTGTDETHLATEHIHELRKLVETGAPEHGADPADDSRIVAELPALLPLGAGLGTATEQVLEHAIGIENHGAELQAVEGNTIATDTPVAIDHRAGIIHPQDECDPQHQGQEKHDQHAGEDDVAPALGDGAEPFVPRSGRRIHIIEDKLVSTPCKSAGAGFVMRHRSVSDGWGL